MDPLEILLGRRVPRRQRIYFVGAGISAEGPTCLPVGNRLTEAYLRAFTPSSFPEAFFGIFRATAFLTLKEFPRLEMVVQDLHRHAPGVLHALHFLNDSRPNHFHEWIAQDLRNGSTVFTTNFDNYIERAFEHLYGRRPIVVADPAQTQGNWTPGMLVKLHGDLSNLDGLGVRIDTIQNGLPERFSRLLRDALRAEGVFIFLGYGGFDYFDITPAFAAAGDVSNKAQAVWVIHQVRPRLQEIRLQSLPEEARAPLQRILGCFPESRVYLGPTRLLSPRCPEGEEDRTFDWTSSFTVRLPRDLGDYERSMSAAQLAAAIGYGPLSYQYIRLSSAYSAFGVSEAQRNLHANALRDMGRYRDELRLQQRWRRGTSDEDRSLLRRERLLLASYHLYGQPRKRTERYQAVRRSHAYRNEMEERTWLEVENVRFTVSERLSWRFPFWTGRTDHQWEQMLNYSLASAWEGLRQHRDPRLLATFLRTVLQLGDHRDELSPRLRRTVGELIASPHVHSAQSHLELYRETDSMLGVVNATRQMAEHLMRSGGESRDRARHLLEQSIAVCGLIGSPSGVCKASTLLAECCRSDRRMRRAYIQQARDAAGSVQWSPEAVRSLERRWSS